MATSFVPTGGEARHGDDSHARAGQHGLFLYAGEAAVWHSRFDNLKLVNLADSTQAAPDGVPDSPLEAGDEIWAAYLPLSGGTHMLNFFTYAVLRLLHESPMTPAALLTALDQADLRAGSVPLAVVSRTLQELDAAGLIYAAGIEAHFTAPKTATVKRSDIERA